MGVVGLRDNNMIKRKLATREQRAQSPVVIDLFSDPDEPSHSAHPPKRHKSNTPDAHKAVNGKLSSRDSPQTPSPRSEQGQSTPVRSPWSKISPYSHQEVEAARLALKRNEVIQSRPPHGRNARVENGFFNLTTVTPIKWESGGRQIHHDFADASWGDIHGVGPPITVPFPSVPASKLAGPAQASSKRTLRAAINAAGDQALESPSRRLIAVEITVRSSPSVSGSREPVRSRLEISQSKPRLEVVVPSARLDWPQRRSLIARVDANTEDPKEVERCIGVPRFSFDTKEDSERLKRGKSKKVREALNKSVPFDLGSDLGELFGSLRVSPDYVRPAQIGQDLLTGLFKAPMTAPLTFTDDITHQRVHGKFQFTDRYVMGEGIKMVPPTPSSGCTCTSCHTSTCSCFTKDVSAASSGDPETRQVCTYTRLADGTVVLSDEFLENKFQDAVGRFEVTECNEFCGCPPDCMNRVVGRGRTVPLEIFMTEKCGFGVRSSQRIYKGQFIDLYLGELITENELVRREQASEDGESSYVYSLDWFESHNTLHVDGKMFGSAMRFANHSCKPNAKSFPVQLHKLDKKVYYLAFFAIRDIEAGVEIRIDYSGSDDLDPGSDIPPGRTADGELTDGLVRCRCGEKPCRKFLWKTGVKITRRKRLQS